MTHAVTTRLAARHTRLSRLGLCGCRGLLDAAGLPLLRRLTLWECVSTSFRATRLLGAARRGRRAHGRVLRRVSKQERRAIFLPFSERITREESMYDVIGGRNGQLTQGKAGCSWRTVLASLGLIGATRGWFPRMSSSSGTKECQNERIH